MTKAEIGNMVASICNISTTNKIYNVNETQFDALSELILTGKIIDIVDGRGARLRYSGDCDGCRNPFNWAGKCNEHIINHDDCAIYYTLYYVNPKRCPPKNRNAIWNTQFYMGGVAYNWHLPNGGKQVPPIDNDIEQSADGCVCVGGFAITGCQKWTPTH